MTRREGSYVVEEIDHSYFLHMVDMWSRLTQSAIITRKEPKEVIDKFMLHWVAVVPSLERVMSSGA